MKLALLLGLLFGATTVYAAQIVTSTTKVETSGGAIVVTGAPAGGAPFILTTPGGNILTTPGGNILTGP